VTRVAVLQSNYLPWKGYFDIVHGVDLFVFYDDLQYTKNDWRNRNKVKTDRGATWLTIPVGTDIRRRICDVALADPSWQVKHWAALSDWYASTAHFARYADFFRDVYLGRRWTNLSALNQYLIQAISRDFLGIRTEFADSRTYAPVGARQDRLLDLLKKAGASWYLTGPAARDYIDPARFAEAGIALAWQSYAGYPEYEQRFPPFEHGVSIVDLLFNVGPAAPEYIWGWREG
jgi:hypothetical protein